MSMEDFGPFAATTTTAATALVPPSTSTKHVQTTPSSTAQVINDAAFMESPPLTHSSEPRFTPVNYGRSVSYLPPTGSKEEAKDRPPVYDNVTIPPHLVDIIRRDVFDLAVKTGSVLLPPPKERDYNLLGAWYTAANDLSMGRMGKGYCPTFLQHKAYYDVLALCTQQGNFSPGQTPAEVWLSNGVELVAVDGSAAQHIQATNCSQCLIHAFRMVQERIRREKGVEVRLQQDMARSMLGGINKQVRNRHRDNVKRKMPREVTLRLSGSGPLAGGEWLPNEYARAFERWDVGMQKTVPGYAGSERRRAWYARRDQGVW